MPTRSRHDYALDFRDQSALTESLQLREGTFKGDRPACGHCGSTHVHRHGHYKRYAQPSGGEQFCVFRFLCRDCGHTMSVLAANRLPYRPLEVQRLQSYFDTQAGWASGLDPPPDVAETGCLQRAWQRLGQRTARLQELFGQILPAGLSHAAACWQALRQAVGSARQILLWLARHTHSSLLGDYRCLQPVSLA